MTRAKRILAGLSFLAFAGCGSSGDNCTLSDKGDAQTPAECHNNVEAWLAGASYLKWHCEPMPPHDARSPSPHGKNRICSNDKLSGSTGTGEYPVDSGAVKELYESGGTNIVGYAVYRHIKAGTTGDTWYWYERTANVVADGAGVALCVGCHQAAGKDAQHSGHDFVYTQVK